ncbi:MAG: precorrin-8X methylmutase [Kiloniellales bacterium]|nr:precorrin-8X methylmutase [Kiloniellales bacterium]
MRSAQSPSPSMGEGRECAALRAGGGGTQASDKSNTNVEPQPFDYLRDPAEITRRSFAIVEAEAELSRLPEPLRPVARRLVHACGMPEIIDDLAWGGPLAETGRLALEAGAPVLADCRMVAEGVTRARLPRNNAVLCTLGDPRVPDLALELGTTRSAAALELWGDDLAGAVVAIGNAPTALFRLLELLQAGAPRPAVILGFPVGFVGAAESKEALIETAGELPYLTLRGRRGGSALAAAAVNALAAG